MIRINSRTPFAEWDNVMNSKPVSNMLSARSAISILCFDHQFSCDVPHRTTLSTYSTSPKRRGVSRLMLFPEVIPALTGAVTRSTALSINLPRFFRKDGVAVFTGEHQRFNKLRMLFTRWMKSLSELIPPFIKARMRSVLASERPLFPVRRAAGGRRVGVLAGCRRGRHPDLVAPGLFKASGRFSSTRTGSNSQPSTLRSYA